MTSHCAAQLQHNVARRLRLFDSYELLVFFTVGVTAQAARDPLGGWLVDRVLSALVLFVSGHGKEIILRS
jgi:hypothetical protein